MRKKFEDLTSGDLWQLRQEIVLNSLFVADYNNSFGFAADSVCTFFDGYVDYLGELAIESGYDNVPFLEMLDKYDSEDNLFTWYYCCDDYSWFKYDPEWTEEEEMAYADYYNGAIEKEGER